ncbi:MAG TPA: ABC transporter substrate-binding protein [Terriglobales bacterium]|nr:ABC transporter substrate-binding protein [Terriglobales bacterium]
MKRSASALIAATSLLIATGSMAATRPHYGGTLRIAVQIALTSLDPADSTQPDSLTRRNLSRLIFDTLVDLDDRGTLQPAIATSWEPEPGNQRWHFYLRPGISFHDATAVSPDAVAASLRTANPNWKVFSSGNAVVVECDSPNPHLPVELALPRNGIAKREGGKLLGSGPFAISHWDPGKKLELSARDDYWRGRVFLDSIEIEMDRNSREQLIELDLGKADVIEIAPEQAHRMAMEGRAARSSAPFELIALGFSRDPQTPDEARQRQVLALSIDRVSMNNVLLQGAAEPTGALLPDWMTGYGFLFPSEADLSRARQLRSEIRYAPSWSLGYDANDALARVVAERITLNARDAGLSVQLTNGGTADFRLIRIPLASSDAALALTKLAENLRLPQPKFASDSPSDLYAGETSLLESKRIIPLLHLKATIAGAVPVKNWVAGLDGSWRIQDVWLATEKP